MIGGVESNPADSPKSVADTLPAQSVGATDTNIRDCIRLYRVETTTAQHRKTFMKCDKATIVDTMNYLKVTGQSEYNKGFVVNNLIVRIQNLLPDTCKICNIKYCTDLDETAVLGCSLCAQAAHNQCLAEEMAQKQDQCTWNMRQYNTLSTQKSPVRQQNAWFDTKKPGSTQKARFDTKMPYPACINWHCHYQKSPLFYWNYFLTLIRHFVLKNPYLNFKQLSHSKRCSSRPPCGQGFTMHSTRNS